MYLEVEHTARDEIISESALVEMILVKHVVEDRTTLKESRKSGECIRVISLAKREREYIRYM